MKCPWIAIQRNPISGAGPKRHLVLELIQHLKKYGFVPRVFSRREKLEKLLKKRERRENLACIVAAGGDGTVRDVINRFPGWPLAILPLGTENLVARYLQIPPSGRAVAQMIAARSPRRIDVSVLGGRKFLIMASFGIDADIVHRTHERRTGHIRKWNYLQSIRESLINYRYPQLRLYLDDARHPLSARMAVVTNLPMYALGLKISASALENDGLLDVCLFQRGSAFQTFRYFLKSLQGTHVHLEHVKTARAVRVRVESDHPIPVQADGDPAGWTPAEVRVLPGELEIFVPVSPMSAEEERGDRCQRIP